MERISQGALILRAAIFAMLLLSLWLGFRLLRGLRDATRRWTPLSVFRNPVGMAQVVGAFVIILALAWNASQPYSLLAAIFPCLADPAAVTLLLFAIVMLLSAFFPRRCVEKSSAMD